MTESHDDLPESISAECDSSFWDYVVVVAIATVLCIGAAIVWDFCGSNDVGLDPSEYIWRYVKG